MKNRATIKNAGTSKRPIRRIFILALVFLMLPGCVTRTDTGNNTNGRWFQNATIVAYNAAYGYGTTTSDNSIKKTSIVNTDKNNPVGVNAIDPVNETPAADNPGVDPFQSMIADNKIDQHDAGEEEKVISIKFHALMRIGIMLLLVVLII